MHFQSPLQSFQFIRRAAFGAILLSAAHGARGATGSHLKQSGCQPRSEAEREHQPASHPGVGHGPGGSGDEAELRPPDAQALGSATSRAQPVAARSADAGFAKLPEMAHARAVCRPVRRQPGGHRQDHRLDAVPGIRHHHRCPKPEVHRLQRHGRGRFKARWEPRFITTGSTAKCILRTLPHPRFHQPSSRWCSALWVWTISSPSPNPKPAQAPKPRYTGSGGGHYVSPGDLAIIYDVLPIYQAGYTGQGQTIAVIGQSNIQLSDIAAFRSDFGLSSNLPQIVLVPGSAGSWPGGRRRGRIGPGSRICGRNGAGRPGCFRLFHQRDIVRHLRHRSATGARNQL